MEVSYFNSTINDYLLSLEKLGFKLTMPYSKPISRNLFELRIRSKQEIRIFYCFFHRKIYLLHAFIKKTQKSPRREIDIAQKRISLLT